MEEAPLTSVGKIFGYDKQLRQNRLGYIKLKNYTTKEITN